MIEPEDYRLPKKEQPREKPQADPATLEQLTRLPWRPFTTEW